MDFSALFTREYLPYTIFVALIIIFILYRSFKSVKMYMGARSYVRKSKRLRKRKYNGLVLVEYTQKKRKKNTNNFAKLRRRAKKKVKKYLKAHRYILDAKDFDEIIDLAKSKMTIDIFVKYMQDSGFKEDILDNAIFEAKNVVKRSLIYKSYIDELKDSYLETVK